MSNWQYQKVPTARVPKSMSNNSFTNKMTGVLGKLYPICCKQMIPGDVFRISVSSYVKFMPSINPIFHDMYCKTRWFFVPHRLVDEDFEEAITGGEDGESKKGFPIWNPDAAASQAPKTSVCVHDTLWDYFNFPLLDTESNYSGSLSSENTFDDECMPLAYPVRSYNVVWNDWFRDEETQAKVVEKETESGYNYSVLRVNWQKDRFTSAGQEEQRGTAPALPLSGTLPVIFSTQRMTGGGVGNMALAIDAKYHTSNFNYWEAPTTQQMTGLASGETWNTLKNYLETKHSLDEYNTSGKNLYFLSAPLQTTSDENIPPKFKDNYYHSATQGNVSLGNAGTFTIKDIRLTNAIQKWQERNEECGSRYGEYLRGQYGVYPKDERLQRPEYIGGTVTGVSTSPVLQHANTDDNPLGKEATRATALDQGLVGTYKAFEFGTLIGLMYIVPRNSYISQGFPAEWMWHDKFDFPNPLFSHLGNVPVRVGEIYAKGTKEYIDGQTVHKGDDTIFGWQGKDDELRDTIDKTSSGFRTADFNNWTFDRSFADYPGNNSQFRQINLDSNNVFVSQNNYQFAAYIGVGLKTVRPIPKFAIPLLG